MDPALAHSQSLETHVHGRFRGMAPAVGGSGRGYGSGQQQPYYSALVGAATSAPHSSTSSTSSRGT
jgi:hypothetical protein